MLGTDANTVRTSTWATNCPPVRVPVGGGDELRFHFTGTFDTGLRNPGIFSPLLCCWWAPLPSRLRITSSF